VHPVRRNENPTRLWGGHHGIEHAAGKVVSFRRRLHRDERGQGLVEYALIIAIVSLGAVVALGFLSGKINTLFSNAGNSLDNITVAAASDGGGGGGGGGGGTSPPVAGSMSISCSATHFDGVCDDSPATMTVAPGTWGGSPTPTLSYQWATNGNGSAGCNTTDTAGWTNVGGSSATVNLPNISDFSGTDLMRVIVTGSNADPGSPVKAAVCRTFRN
jgi:pilus assembly protein Flp/PilA